MDHLSNLSVKSDNNSFKINTIPSQDNNIQETALWVSKDNVEQSRSLESENAVNQDSKSQDLQKDNVPDSRIQNSQEKNIQDSQSFEYSMESVNNYTGKKRQSNISKEQLNKKHRSSIDNKNVLNGINIGKKSSIESRTQSYKSNNTQKKSSISSNQIQQFDDSKKQLISSKDQLNEANDLASIQQTAIQNIDNNVIALANNMKSLSAELNLQTNSSTSDNIEKITRMSKMLTNEANALSDSIKKLSNDIIQTKQDLELDPVEDISNFPYHLFLLEIIINRIQMKCECFEPDFKDLVISCTFLGKPSLILYNSTPGKNDNFSKLNVGKSILFAMTYDRICTINDFTIFMELTREPPCSHCITKVAETSMDFSKEFISLKKELCQKWSEEKPDDKISCTTSIPLSKNQYYLSCGKSENLEPIGVIEVSVRMSFLGKEICTAFNVSPKPTNTSLLFKENNGVTMYSCQKVEMDEQGKVLLDEDTFSIPNPKQMAPLSCPYSRNSLDSRTLQYFNRRSVEPRSHLSQGK